MSFVIVKYQAVGTSPGIGEESRPMGVAPTRYLACLAAVDIAEGDFGEEHDWRWELHYASDGRIWNVYTTSSSEQGFTAVVEVDDLVAM